MPTSLRPPLQPRPPLPAPLLAALLAVALLGNVILALRPGPAALLPATAALWHDVARLDSQALRTAHDGWYARLSPVYAAIEAQVPPDAPLVLRAEGVPPWFVAARFPERAVFREDAAVMAAWRDAGRPFWVLELRNADPLAYSLRRDGEGPP